jgi:hypothetical protein
MALKLTVPVGAALVVIGAAAAASCGRAMRPAVEPELAACLPSNTLAIVGVDLARFRGSPLYSALPPELTALLEPAREASYVVLAYNGKTALGVARGTFRSAPAGGVLLAKGLAAFGRPETIRAADSQRKTGKTGAGWLLQRADSVARQQAIWGIAVGGTTLPFPGNAANLNRLLRDADYVTLGVTPGDTVSVNATAVHRTETSAREFEATVRGIASLASSLAGSKAGQPGRDVGFLRTLQVRREGLTVHTALSATPAEIANALGVAAR